MADGGKRVADLMRDVCGQPPKRGELELLRLLPRARGVLDEKHPELLFGARVEEPKADVATADLEVRRRAERALAPSPRLPSPCKAGEQLGHLRAEEPLHGEQA